MLIHYRMPLLIFIHASPILIHASAILIHWLGFRLSAPYLITLNRYDSSRQPRTPENPRLSAVNQYQLLRHPSRQPIRIEHGKNPSTSSANQCRLLGNPSRRPFRVDYHVTRVVSHSELSITSPESSLRQPRALG